LFRLRSFLKCATFGKSLHGSGDIVDTAGLTHEQQQWNSMSRMLKHISERIEEKQLGKL
jgi:hypothetical protein